MTTVFFGVLFTVFQCFDGVLFLDLFLKRRLSGCRFWWAAAGLSVGFGVLINLLRPRGVPLKMAVVLGGFWVLALVLYRGRCWFRLLVVSLFYALLNGVEQLLVFGTLTVLHTDLNTLYASRALFHALTAAEQFLVLTLLLAARRLAPSHRVEYAARRWWPPTLFLAVGSTLVSASLMHAAVHGDAAADVVVVCTAFLVCVNVLVICLIDWLEQSARARESTLALNEKLHAQAESIEALTDAYGTQRRLTHDYAAHLACLDGYLSQGDCARARDYVRELLRQQTDRLLAVNSHNPALDALFNQKARAAEKQGIDLRFVVNDLSGLQIRTGDLAVLISNLMDNAMEASLGLPQPRREVKVRAILEETFLFSVRNRSLPVEIVDGTIPSTKPDPSLHGYGLANVNTILDLYPDSFRNMSYKDGWFTHVIELPNRVRS